MHITLPALLKIILAFFLKNYVYNVPICSVHYHFFLPENEIIHGSIILRLSQVQYAIYRIFVVKL